DFPDLDIVINGGIVSRSEMQTHWERVDGVMLGRAAYHNPWVLADPGKTRSGVVRLMHDYATREIPKGVSLRSIARHMLGLYHGCPRARLWRQRLSDARLLKP